MSRYFNRDYDLANIVEGRADRGSGTSPPTTTVQAGLKLDLLEMKNEMRSMSPPVCRSVVFGLSSFGVWPETSRAILCRLLYVSSMVMIQIFQYQYLFMCFGKVDLSIFVDALSMTLAYSMLFIKMMFFIFNRRLLNETLAYLFEDWRERDTSNEDIMTGIAYTSRVLSNWIISTYAISVLFYAMGTVMAEPNNQTGTGELIFKMELPFEIKDTSVYVTVLLTQFLHQTCAASTVAVLNCLLLTLVLHICGQIDIVRRKLKEITREQNVPKSVTKTVIVRHQRIIAFSKNIEALYSYIALIQFISSTFVICCSGFLVVISLGVPNGSMMVIKFLLFYIVISMDGFIFCYVGEYLSMKSKMIGDAAYESQWYDLKPNQNQDVFFVILRSQKELTLTIGKFVELSLKQFGNIVKASVSYVSVLYAMY